MQKIGHQKRQSNCKVAYLTKIQFKMFNSVENAFHKKKLWGGF